MVVDYLCFTRRPEDFSESETESREACFDLAITGSGAGLAHRNVVEVAVVRIDFIASSPLAVHGAITTYGAPTWIFSAVYASTDYRERIDFWAEIDDMAGMGMPMLVMGSLYFRCNRKKGWSSVPGRYQYYGIPSLFVCVDRNEMAAGFIGNTFTWTNNRRVADLVMERLDRAFFNFEWKLQYQDF